MARSLLSFKFVYVVLLASASSMSACIIPVAPNFQDPPSTPDAPPNLSNFLPKTFGEVVTVLPAGQVFSATVTDLNLGATLRVRWAVDYPPLGDTTYAVDQSPIPPRVDGKPISQQIMQLIDCTWIKQPVTTTHQLELIVADREFIDSSTFGLPADNKLDSIMDPTGNVVRALWTVSISCPAITTSSMSSP